MAREQERAYRKKAKKNLGERKLQKKLLEQATMRLQLGCTQTEKETRSDRGANWTQENCKKIEKSPERVTVPLRCRELGHQDGKPPEKKKRAWALKQKGGAIKTRIRSEKRRKG